MNVSIKTKASIILAFFISFGSFGQRFQYYSLSAYSQVSALSNYKYKDVQNRPYFSGGIDYGTSLTEMLNLKGGVNYMSMYLDNGRKKHSICDDPNQRCFVESEMNYLSFPLGLEFYSNASKLESKSYYIVKLIPMFSVASKMIRTEFYSKESEETPGEFILIDDEYITQFSNFKFQDLHLELGLGGDIALSHQYKLYFEPSVQHSITFRTEDLVNPNYMISLRIGIRLRSEKSK